MPSWTRYSPSQLRALRDQIRDAKSLWKPLPGPQTAAYYSPADELFYGGAAGGGKSDLLIGLAVTQHLRSIIFRREFPQLQQLEERAREIIGARGRENRNERIWRDLPGGRQLQFGAVQYEHDVARYQGRAHDLKLFDELAHFAESQYRFLIGWSRTSTPGQRVRVVSAGNPPTPHQGRWIIDAWAPWLKKGVRDLALPGELRWYAMIDGDIEWYDTGEAIEHKGEIIRPSSRTFIPALLGDNPYLLATGYEKTLQALPEPLRSQMLFGDFEAGVEDDSWQVIPTAWVVLAQQRWRQIHDAGQQPTTPPRVIGNDVARGGKDRTVYAPNHGTYFARLLKVPGSDTPDGMSVVARALPLLGPHTVMHVDIIGVGGSAFDHFKLGAIRVKAMNASEKSDAVDRATRTLTFVNKRAEWWWQLRESLDPTTGDDLALPDDPEVLADLTAPRYELRPGGIKVESKDEIVRRLGHSPDCGDAIVYASVPPPMPITPDSFLGLPRDDDEIPRF